MDVEKTIEFILDLHAKTEVALARLTERAEKAEARLEKSENRLEKSENRMESFHDRLAKTEALLRRAIRLAVREARNERKRRQEFNAEFEKKMTQLSAAQLITEERLQGFINSLRLRGNGNPSE